MRTTLLLNVLLASSVWAQDLTPPPVPEPVVAPVATSPFTFKASLSEGIKIESADGNYGVQPGLLVWTRFEDVVNDAGNKVAFSVPLLRPTLRAHFFRPWISIFVQPELAGTPRMLDFELDLHPVDEVAVKLGQFLTPFSRAFLTPVPKLQFQGFTQANVVFRSDRDTGAMVYGTFFTGRLEYYAGIFNGNGLNFGSNDNPQLLWSGRLAGTLFGTPPPAKGSPKYDETAALAGTQAPTLMIGADGYINRVSTTGQADQIKRTASVDLAFVWKRFFAQSEGYYQTIDTVDGGLLTRYGADAQAGFFIMPGTLDLAGRFSWVHFDQKDPSAWLVQGDAQLGWYLVGNHLKALARYTLTDTGSAQRGFAPGLSHAVLVQVQVAL